MVSAGVAHEINNPLGFIKSNLTALNEYLDYLSPILSVLEKAKSEDKLGDPSLKDRLIELIEKDDFGFVIEDIDGLIKDAVDGTIRVQEIVAGLKSFARTNETDDVSFDLNECIRSTLKVVWNEVKYKARVDLDLKGIPAIKGNPGQINQVIMNLIVNSAQAIEKQGVINIQTELTDKNVVMRISDNGIGMSDQVMGSIFDPFFTTKDVGKGTGLGLSISHGIVESHGGTIHVESQLNEGTTFTLNFPIPQQHVAELEQVVNG
jgi:signal transduction histidine kinase